MANIKINLTKSDGSVQEYNKSWIENLESTTQSTTDASTIQYEVIANTGNIQMRDLDGQIRSDISSGVLPISNVETTISINGTQIQAHLTNDSNYIESDKTLSLSLTNKLSLLDTMSYNGFPLSETPMTAYELLSDIFNKLGIDMANKVTFTNDALNALTAITIPYPCINPCSGREALNKICEIAQLSMFESDNGRIRVISTTQTNSTSTVYPYKVPSHYKITELNKAIVLKNKYDAIDMKATKVVDEINFGKLCQTTTIGVDSYLINSNNQSNIYKESIWNLGGFDANGYIKLYMNTYYINTPTIIIPKKKNLNKETIIKLLTGTNDKGEPHIKYGVTYKYTEGDANAKTTQPSSIEDFTLIEHDWKTTEGTGDIPTKFGYGISETVIYEVSIPNKSTNGVEAVFTEDGNNYYVNLLLLVGCKYLGVTGNDKNSNWGEDGYYYQYTPLSAEVSIYGNVRTINFEDVEASTPNIAIAKNPVSLRHNELLQLGATWGDTSLVDKIKDNVLADYKNGISTATIDLFCGNLSNGRLSQTLDWKSGEILSINNKIKFADDKEDLVWDITGRTFTYSASPKLRLELKRMSSWNKVWDGDESVAFPSRSSVHLEQDGFYYGSSTTYFTLEDGYIKNSNYPIRISGNGEYNNNIKYNINAFEVGTEWSVIKEGSVDYFGEVAVRYNAGYNRIEIKVTGRHTKPNTMLLRTISFNLTKIEQYY